MKTNSGPIGILFALAAFLAIGGPMLINHVGEEPYMVPEPPALSTADAQAVETQVATFCGPGPHRTAEPTWPPPPVSQEVPVILYHRITNDKPSHEVTRPALFHQQIDWLKAEGYETISTLQLESYLLGKGTIPKKPVIISFDDGWKDNVEAAEYLKKLDMGATFYVVSGFLSAPQYLNHEELLELSRNPKFEIGSHSHSHFVKHEEMDKVDLCTFAKELAASKLLLERLTGKPIRSFAWPYGFATKEGVFAARALGYTNTTHVNIDSHNSAGHSPLFVRRMNIDGNCGLDEFKKMIETNVLKECSPRSK